MSTELDQARSIAERIARKVSAGALATDRSYGGHSNPDTKLTDEIAAVRASIGELQAKLVQLESRAQHAPAGSFSPSANIDPPYSRSTFVPPTHSPWLAGVNAAASHPTEERFGVEEATINELVDYFQSEKTCSIDPSGKPCDHCAMCSSRGF
jgi:hypothetical protein